VIFFNGKTIFSDKDCIVEYIEGTSLFNLFFDFQYFEYRGSIRRKS